MRNSFKDYEEEMISRAIPPSPNIEKNIKNVVSNSRNLSTMFEHYFVKSFRLIGILFGSEKNEPGRNVNNRDNF